jgi:hypothetical protein
VEENDGDEDDDEDDDDHEDEEVISYAEAASCLYGNTADLLSL